MPFALLIVALILIIVAVEGTQTQLITTLEGDFTGPNSFVTWFAAILILGIIGYVAPLKGFSKAFIVLVIIVLLLAKGNTGQAQGVGFFQGLSNAVRGQSGTQPVL